MEQERLYKDLAWLWPILSPPEEYIEEGEFFADLIKSYSSGKPETLLHLGCGGGHLDMTLKKHFEITGVDKSESMLGLARRLNPESRYIAGDMRNIRIDDRFEVVLIYDSVNYMLSPEDLKSSFETAYHHLKPGGIAVTCVEQTPETFRQNAIKHNSRARGDIELTYFYHLYDPDKSDSTYETIFVYLIRKNGVLEIKTDKHICGIFSLETWEKLLRESGFKSKRDTFRHSTFSPGEEYPILIGLKKEA